MLNKARVRKNLNYVQTSCAAIAIFVLYDVRRTDRFACIIYEKMQKISGTKTVIWVVYLFLDNDLMRSKENILDVIGTKRRSQLSQGSQCSQRSQRSQCSQRYQCSQCSQHSEHSQRSQHSQARSQCPVWQLIRLLR